MIEQLTYFGRHILIRQTLFLYRFAEKGVLVHFVILALLWAVRDPKFVSGWCVIFKDG